MTIHSTQLGTNGKGTDRNYALTSGYAELMERIQNNILYIGEMSEEDKQYGGFIHFPDQKLVSFEKIMIEHSDFMERIFQALDCVKREDKIAVLRDFANMKKMARKKLAIFYIIENCFANFIWVTLLIML